MFDFAGEYWCLADSPQKRDESIRELIEGGYTFVVVPEPDTGCWEFFVVKKPQTATASWT